MKWNQDAEREYWRHKCLDSFWWFFRYAWGYDFNPKGAGGKKPWLYESSHKPACDWFEHHALQWMADRDKGLDLPMKLLVVVPRDWGKTTLFTQAGQVWLQLHDPELASYTGCETQPRAREVLDGIKSVISGIDRYSRYAWLYGAQRHSDRIWKRDNVVTASRTNLTRRDASYGTWAVEAGLVGLHPDACFFDDPNTYEQMQRKSNWLDIVNQHLDTLIPVFQSDAFWMLTGTRYGDGDHIGKTIRLEGAKTVSGMPMPGVVPSEGGTWHVFFMDALDDDNNCVMPKIWSRERIETFERRNPLRYYAQVRNNPTRSPHNILTRTVADQMIVEPDKVDLKKLRVSIHLDTAFKSPKRKARGDYNVIGAVGHMTDGSGRVVYLGAKSSREWESKQFGDNLIESVKNWRGRCARVVCMTDEQDIGGKPGLWPAFLQNIFRTADVAMPELITINSGSTRKPDRLAEAAALWRDGRMLLLRNAPDLELLLDQMTKIGMSEHDDHADAIAACFHKLVYSAVYSKGPTALQISGRNPFDDVLKPGAVGDLAAEKIAEAYADKERIWSQQFHGIVQP